jgi:hypothetical protein
MGISWEIDALTLYMPHCHGISNGRSRLPFLGPTEVGMSRKTKQLGKYIKSRKAKYRNPPRILFHTSPSPRKVLTPRRTSYSNGCPECERWESLVYLSPFKNIKAWAWWAIERLPQPELKRAYKSHEKGDPVILYVHVVEVDPGDVHILNEAKGYDNIGEYVTVNAVRPRAIVPIRLYHDRPLNLSRVSAVASRIKKERHSKASSWL